MEKIHISQYISKLTDDELMKAVEAFLEWQVSEIGIRVIETKTKKNRTAIDDIYDEYMEPLNCGPGISPWLSSYKIITTEIAKRVYLKTFQRE